jgi:hypothetical protein
MIALTAMQKIISDTPKATSVSPQTIMAISDTLGVRDRSCNSTRTLSVLIMGSILAASRVDGVRDARPLG